MMDMEMQRQDWSSKGLLLQLWLGSFLLVLSGTTWLAESSQPMSHPFQGNPHLLTDEGA